MAKLKFYFFDGSYQYNSFSVETETMDVEKNIEIAKDRSKTELLNQIDYRKQDGYWAEVSMPGYGAVRIWNKDNDFYFWDTTKEVKNEKDKWILMK